MKNKIEIAALISVTAANPNGDPLNGNMPRTLLSGEGIMTDVCLKHKIRNAMVRILGLPVLVRGNDLEEDGHKDIRSRVTAVGGDVAAAAKTFADVRAFGATLAWKSTSCAIRGPVSVSHAISLSPIDIMEIQITKSCNSDTKEGGGRGSDTMGMKYMVPKAEYLFHVVMSPTLAKYTGFTDEDAENLIKAVALMFEGDASSARPEGSMEISSMLVVRHDNPIGSVSSGKLRKMLTVSNGKLELPVIEGAVVEDYPCR